jgi:hypothetical protein
MEAQTQISEAVVRSLAAAAGLPLAEGRETLIASQLRIWISGANELSRKMSEPEHSRLAPIEVFTHPGR